MNVVAGVFDVGLEFWPLQETGKYATGRLYAC